MFIKDFDLVYLIRNKYGLLYYDKVELNVFYKCVGRFVF